MSKQTKIKELRKLSPEQLFSEYKKEQSTHEKLRTKLAYRRLKDFSQIRKSRCQIARILTILNEVNNES